MTDEETWAGIHAKQAAVMRRMGFASLTNELVSLEVCRRLSQGYYPDLTLTAEERAVIKRLPQTLTDRSVGCWK